MSGSLGTESRSHIFLKFPRRLQLTFKVENHCFRSINLSNKLELKGFDWNRPGFSQTQANQNLNVFYLVKLQDLFYLDCE